MNNIYQSIRIHSAQDYQLREKQRLINYIPSPNLYISPIHLKPFILRRVKSSSNLSEYYDNIVFTTIEIQNIYSNKSYDILDDMAFDFGVRGSDTLTNQIYDYALYRGESTISRLPQGIYQLHLEDENGNEFYSEIFKIWYPDYTIKFEYKNSDNISDLWFYSDLYYEMEFGSYVRSTGEFDEYISNVPDKYNHNIKTFQRIDEIFAVDLFADTFILGAFKLMSMCDTIYLTDELGQKKKIEITDIVNNNITNGCHASYTVKFRIIDYMLTSEKQDFQWIGGIEGSTPVTKDIGIYRGGKGIYRGGRRIIRR